MLNMKLLLKFCVFGWLALNVAQPFQASAKNPSKKGDLRSQNQNLDNLFWSSGRENVLQNIQSVLGSSEIINKEVLTSRQGEFARIIMRQAYSRREVTKVLKQPFLNNYNPQHVITVVKWYQSPLGQKILRLENATQISDKQKVVKLFEENLLDLAPSEERISLVEKIDHFSGMTEAGKSLYLGYVKLMYPFNKKAQKKRLGKLLRILKESSTEPIREIILTHLLFSFKDLENKELKKYVRFLSSSGGRWFSESALMGIKKAIAQNLLSAENIQEKLLMEIKSGGPEFRLLKQIAPPGQRYELIGKRDPFRSLVKTPLVEKEGLVSLSDEGKKSNARLFGEELSDVPPMALPVFVEIRDQHQELYRSLKHYEALINDREALEGMADYDYADLIENYRSVLEKAAGIKMEESPLQVEFESLRMTGIIRKKSEAVAMFEIGNTGYAVRKGDKIGPSFGYVGEVQAEQVIVVEKFRDYLGNILTNQKVIEFYEGITY